jgi:hypothetical protein
VTFNLRELGQDFNTILVVFVWNLYKGAKICDIDEDQYKIFTSKAREKSLEEQS